MRPLNPLIISLLTAAALAMAPGAQAATHHKHKTTAQASAKKSPASPKKTVARVDTTLAPSVKGSVSRRAIAQARRGVRVQPAMALSSMDNPGVQSAAVLILNENSGDVVYQKNPDNVTPIASISKLMTAMVTLDAHLPMNEFITISEEDVDTLKNTSSRLTVGTRLTRAEVMLLALMSSENRAAAALARTYPGGKALFITKMNEKKPRRWACTARIFL